MLTHVLFALHWTAFYFLVEAARQVLALPDGFSPAVGAVLAVWVVLALRRAYGIGVVSAVLRGFALLLPFALLLAVWVVNAVELATLVAG